MEVRNDRETGACLRKEFRMAFKYVDLSGSDKRGVEQFTEFDPDTPMVSVSEWLSRPRDVERRSRLKESLIFHMSLGSKELFHSNTWAWLMERDISFVKLFFPDIPEDVPLTITREEGNRDLTIWVNRGTPKEKAYVIENKFKSIPRRGQLIQYEGEVGPKFQKGVITGIEKPTWMSEDDVAHWRFLSYQELSRDLRDIVEKSSQLGEYKTIMLDYCTMIDDMNSVLLNFLNSRETKLLTTEECLSLSDVRLEDLVNKVSAERFIAWLQGQEKIVSMKKMVEEKGLKFLICTDYSKKHSIVDVRIINDARPENEIIKDHGVNSPWLMGVQIENDNYGRCFQVGAQTKKINGKNWGHEDIFNKFNELGWLPSKNDLPNSTKKRVQYGRYEVRGKYSFVYQPEKLTDMTYEALYKKLLVDMTIACDFIEKHNVQSILCQ